MRSRIISPLPPRRPKDQAKSIDLNVPIGGDGGVGGSDPVVFLRWRGKSNPKLGLPKPILNFIGGSYDQTPSILKYDLSNKKIASGRPA
jgi:hypothetical protein